MCANFHPLELCHARHTYKNPAGNACGTIRFPGSVLVETDDPLAVGFRGVHLKGLVTAVRTAYQSERLWRHLPFAKPCNNIAMRLPLQGRTNSGKSNSSD